MNPTENTLSWCPWLCGAMTIYCVQKSSGNQGSSSQNNYHLPAMLLLFVFWVKVPSLSAGSFAESWVHGTMPAVMPIAPLCRQSTSGAPEELPGSGQPCGQIISPLGKLLRFVIFATLTCWSKSTVHPVCHVLYDVAQRRFFFQSLRKLFWRDEKNCCRASLMYSHNTQLHNLSL